MYSHLCILALAFLTPFIFSCSSPRQIHARRRTWGCYLGDGSRACPPLPASVGACLALSSMQMAERIYLLQREQLPTDLFPGQQTKGQVRPCPLSSPRPPAVLSSLRDANPSSGQNDLCLGPPWASCHSTDITLSSHLRSVTLGSLGQGSVSSGCAHVLSRCHPLSRVSQGSLLR